MSEEYTEEFERFWGIYPRHVAKHSAWKAWKARLKAGISPEELSTSAGHYAEHCLRTRTEQQFIMHPSTFLGPSLRYEDWTEERKIGKPQPSVGQELTSYWLAANIDALRQHADS